MNKFTITVYPKGKEFEGKKITASEGDILLRVLRRAGFSVPASCGGQGTCGKCRIIIKGSTCCASPSPFLRKEEISKGYCLACLVMVEGDMEVEIPPESRVDEDVSSIVAGDPIRGTVRSDGSSQAADTQSGKRAGADAKSQDAAKSKDTAESKDAAGSRIVLEEKPVVKNRLVLGKWEIETRARRVHLRLESPSLEDPRSDIERLRADLVSHGFGGERIRCPLPILRKLSRVVRSGSWQITVTLIELPDGVEILDIQPGDHSQHHLGLAIDIGTTTVVVYLVDLLTGQVIDTAAGYNAQIRCGEDVISRIIYARTPAGLEELHQLVIGTINELIGQILERAGLPEQHINCIVAAGNTTMIHLLLQLDPRYIREDPYIPTISSVPPIKAYELGLRANQNAYLYCLPAIASYVGGDITAGILTTGMHKEAPLTLFIDIGTNGEIVLGNEDWMVTASCSAGPAFEGGEVLHGMRATAGAIDSVTIDRSTMEPKLSVIGHGEPRGICGSGIIDAMAEMFLSGLLDRKGKIRRDIDCPRLREGDHGREYVLAWAKDSGLKRDIVITEIDINNILRAKGAVYAGCSTLLKQMSLGVDDIERFLIAGGFGRYLNIHHAVVIGLLPDIPYEKFRYLGNSSVTGGHLALLSQKLWREAEHIARSTTYLELSTSASFMDEYVSALFLPHTNASLFPKVELLLKRQ
ncbi:MAG: ASKHA domain-containing protein [bacterium]